MPIHEMSEYFVKPVPSLQGRRALVTGATAGIGLATACRLASEGVHLVLVARRGELLDQIKADFLKRFPNLQIDCVPGDVTSVELFEELEKRMAFQVDILVNNAGLALGTAHVKDASLSDWERMIETNVSAAFRMMRYVLPKMIERGGGHIINLGSIAGHTSYEGGSIYCATKHALLAFCKSLRQEVCDKNIRVSVVSPGMVKTEFSEVRFAGDKARAEAVYRGMEPLTAQDIASQIIHCLMQPEHVNVDEIVVMPVMQGAATKVYRRP